MQKLLVPLILLITLIAPPARAQSPLNDEESAALQRVRDAVDTASEWESFVMESTTVLTIDVKSDTRSIEGEYLYGQNPGTLTITSKGALRVIQGDSANVDGIFRVGVQGSNAESVEARLVDGRLYVRSEREGADIPDIDVELMPEGWVLLETLDEWPELTFLFLSDYFTDTFDLGVFDKLIPIQDPASLVSEPEILNDGTQGETITITRRNLEISADETQEFAFGPDTFFYQTFRLDADGRLICYASTSQLDLSSEKRTPETISTSRTKTHSEKTICFSRINQPLEPVAAPEM